MVEAYNASKSARNLCKQLRHNGIQICNGHIDAVERLCAEHNLQYPAEHWKRKTQEELTPKQNLEADMEKARLRAKLSDINQKYTEAVNALNDRERVINEMWAIAGDPLPKPRLVVPGNPEDHHKPQRSAVIHISDWQMGQKVQMVDTGTNVYDWEIMQERQQRWLTGVVGNLRNMQTAYNIEEIVLVYTGDMIEGHNVFKGQAYQLDRDAGAALLQGAILWAQLELGLREELPGILFRRRCVKGNHGKPDGKHGGAIPSTTNFDVLFYQFLADRASNVITDSKFVTYDRLTFETSGWPILITHGDEIRGQLGIPFYGIRTAWHKHSSELQAESRMRHFPDDEPTEFRYWAFGHIHQTSVVTYGDGAAISGGDAVGANNMTGKLRNPYSMPQQSVYYFSRQRGLDEIAYIHLIENQEPVEELV